MAGQFVLLRAQEDPCLPRAFSVLSTSVYGIELFVKSEGRVREKLSNSPFDTVFEVRGPYGTPYEHKIDLDRQYFLVGGGSGCAPLLNFQQQHPECVGQTAFGFRTPDAQELLPAATILDESANGVTAAERALDVWRPDLGVLACGPEPMLRLLARHFRGTPDVFVSLEARIGCGIGTCLGCSIPTTHGPQRICREGPLFALEELPWLT
jgi:dihydroorotate dehydrogenase electron transfer subunit